ncbi:mediator of RNA polymerase II transcription subunit 8 [Cladophialophora chaetospira]|uniref:Mediator of RNA polymerase II transcription subunit 8 n=1 Tax=Cladophialophora chaetospira TaxID=386627 RepID=A0AA39CEA0_9EURO|nr:mediator of RNA polymerase II transcription subunit 8 [Cladophialophora chaetospira]
MAELSLDQVRSLDLTRQRLLALSQSLNSLRDSLGTANPIPSWPDLQTHAQLINNNLQAIATQLSEDSSTLRATVAFPTPLFPGTKSQNVLETLMRTKLEPNIEDWVKEGENINAQQRKRSPRGLSDADRDSLWQWAPGEANAWARKQTWGGDFTRAETLRGVENVVTGLRRELVEPPEDEGEDDGVDEDDEFEGSDSEDEEGDAMDVEKPQPKPETKPATPTQIRTVLPANQMSLSSIHKFMTTGT